MQFMCLQKNVNENQMKTMQFQRRSKQMPNPRMKARTPKGIPECCFTMNVNLCHDVAWGDELILKDFKGLNENSSDAGLSLNSDLHSESSGDFTSEVLTKIYKMKSEPDDAKLLSFDGPQIMACTGSQTHWRKVKHILCKAFQKQSKHKGMAW